MALTAMQSLKPHFVWIPAADEKRNSEIEGVLSWTAFKTIGDHASDAIRNTVTERYLALGHDDPATIIYSSGTTGPSKGVILTHGNLLYDIAALVDGDYRFGVDYRYISYLPLAHIAERTFTVYMPLLVGGHVLCCLDQAVLFSHARKHHPTFFFGVPRVWEKLRAALESMIASEANPENRIALQKARELASRRWDYVLNGLPIPIEVEADFEQIDRAVLHGFRQKVGLEQCPLPDPQPHR